MTIKKGNRPCRFAISFSGLPGWIEVGWIVVQSSWTERDLLLRKSHPWLHGLLVVRSNVYPDAFTVHTCIMEELFVELSHPSLLIPVSRFRPKRCETCSINIFVGMWDVDVRSQHCVSYLLQRSVYVFVCVCVCLCVCVCACLSGEEVVSGGLFT